MQTAHAEATVAKHAEQGLDFFDQMEAPVVSFVTDNPDFQRLIAEQARFITRACKDEKVKLDDVMATTPRFLLTGGAYLELRYPGSDPDHLDNIERRGGAR